MRACSPPERNNDKVTIGLVFPEVWRPNPKKEQISAVRPANIPQAYEPNVPDESEFGEKHIDLIVFPEEYIHYDDQVRLSSLCRLAQEVDTSILVGARKAHHIRDAGWQTLILIKPDGSSSLFYRKHSTSGAVAFELPDWNPQTALPVCSIGYTFFGATICHDSYLGLLQRYLVRQRAKIWINPSYDNVKEEKWSSIFKLRAVENGYISLCTLHDNLARKPRPVTHPYGYGPDGSELKGYSPDRPGDAKPLSSCTEPGIYLVDCDADIPLAKEDPDLLPPSLKQPYRGNSRGRCIDVLVKDGRPYAKSNGNWIPIEHEKPFLVDKMRILPGILPGGQLFDITRFFKILLEAGQEGCKPLFWNAWDKLPTKPEKLVDIMLGRTLEMLAPVVLADQDKIYEITEIAGGSKTMRRISVRSAQGSVDMSFALGLPNAFKMAYDKLKGISDSRRMYPIFLERYKSLL